MKEDICYIDDCLQGKRETALHLQQAIEAAVKKGAKTIHFGAGTYFLQDYTTIETMSIAHDDGCGDISTKDCHIVIKGKQHLTLEGECGADGTPLTILAGDNSTIPQTLLPAVIWAEDCCHLTLKNLAFTRQPECASAGIVKEVTGNRIKVQVFPELPCQDQMAAYCMNRFLVADKKLLGESLTYGFGYDNRFRLIDERLLELTDERIAGQVKVGEGLSWHQSGKTDFQLFFGKCDDLKLENIRIYNTNSFAILTENCKNITAKKLVCKPKGNQFFTGPRDGWKIYRCTGNIMLDECHIEGVRMDGQNIHSNFMQVKEIISSDTLLCVCKYAPISLRNGYRMEFYQETEMTTLTIKSWEIAASYLAETVQAKNATAGAAVLGSTHQMTCYRISFEEEIPSFVKDKTLMTPQCWEPEHYLCQNSVFQNIAGAGHLLRCGQVEIKNCRYQNIMNAGILIGAEYDTHCEGGHGVCLNIHHNYFDNCGFKPRYGGAGMGCIAIKSQGFCAPLNQDIKITDNVFQNSSQALEIQDAQDVSISANRYQSVNRHYIIEEKSTQRINVNE